MAPRIRLAYAFPTRPMRSAALSVQIVRRPRTAAGFGACVLVVVLAAGCSGSRSKSVSIPPVDASPQRVVTAYVAALNAHDVRAARALLTPAHARRVESAADSWFTDVKSITHLRLSRPTIDTSNPRSMRAVVGVRFVLDQYQQESMPNGPTVWTYTLVRHGPNHRWLIDDEGMG